MSTQNENAMFETAKSFLSHIIIESIEWCRGKSWKWRLLILVWFAYILARHISNPMYNSIIGPLNLGIHELGHMIFSIFGEFVGMAGGTILQCLVPVIGMANFYRQNDFFAIMVCFGWLSTNFFDVARYMADARSMELPLAALFGNENVIHDWNYMLGKTGLLQFDTILAFLVRIAAVLSMLICISTGGWLLWQMRKVN